MKAGFAAWNDRIAPVFDVTARLHVVESDGERLIGRQDVEMPTIPDGAKVDCLGRLGVEILVCGAISRPLHAMIRAGGIRVIPFVAGGLEEVIEAWRTGHLPRTDLAMPGCCRRGRRRGSPGARPWSEEECIMSGRNSRGGGGGRGRGGSGGGQSTGGPGRGRMGGPVAGGPTGECVCPNCGHQEPHQRGVPCTRKTCPQCGTALTRR